MVVTAVVCVHDQLNALQTNVSLRQTFLRFAFQCFFLGLFAPLTGQCFKVSPIKDCW